MFNSPIFNINSFYALLPFLLVVIATCWVVLETSVFYIPISSKVIIFKESYLYIYTYFIISVSSISLPRPPLTLDIILVSLSIKLATIKAARFCLFLLLVNKDTKTPCGITPLVTTSTSASTCKSNAVTMYTCEFQETYPTLLRNLYC